MAVPQSVGGGDLKLQFFDFMLWSWVPEGKSASKKHHVVAFFPLPLATSHKTTAPPRWSLQVVLDTRSSAFTCSTSAMEHAKRGKAPRRLGSHIPPKLNPPLCPDMALVSYNAALLSL